MTAIDWSEVRYRIDQAFRVLITAGVFYCLWHVTRVMPNEFERLLMSVITAVVVVGVWALLTPRRERA